MAETKQETEQETGVQEVKSPGITDELKRTIDFLTSIKDSPEEFKKKDRSDPKKNKLENDLIKIMTEFNDNLRWVFIALGLDDDRLSLSLASFSKSQQLTEEGRGIKNKTEKEEDEKEGQTERQAAGAMGGNKSKTQKKQSKNKNKNKTQKKH